VNGAELYFETHGQGAPMLVMHGLGLDHTCLRPWHDGLASQARLIYYDHRWNGRSIHAGPADHATWHADAAALLDGLGEARAIVYGHSYGAWLALGFALRYPERVAGLVLCAASPASDYVPDVIAAAPARHPAAAARLVAGLSAPVERDDELRQIWLDVLPLYFFGPPRPEILAQTRFSARGFAAGMQCLDGFTTVAQLPSIRPPVLVLTGVADFITPPAQGRRIVAGVPRGRHGELSASGHFPFVEENDAYLDAIRAWLQHEVGSAR
jgi:proline iminopeptidase